MPPRRTLAPLLIALAATLTHAQTTPPPPRVTILIDPAHGGSDPGARLPGDALEKDVVSTFAAHLRTLLAAQNFNVVLTREQDSSTNTAPTPTPDQRAEIANHAHPIACLLLHATASGTGVHLFTSTLIPLTIADEAKPVPSWETAQAASIPQSLRLVNELSSSFNSARIPLAIGRASIRPIDSLACPAVALEIAPLPTSATQSVPVTDMAYRQSIADAIVNALLSWRLHSETGAATSGSAR